MNNLIIVRGGGDLATGTIYKLKKSGFPVLVLEVANPSAIRRNVAFCEAVYQGTQTVEDMTCYKAKSLRQAQQFLSEGKLAVLVDPAGDSISQLKPMAVVDAILAKKNLGTNRNMAPITVALGPGFTAGEDVDAVIETKRGHHLGRVLWTGSAAPNTGIPGIIGGSLKAWSAVRLQLASPRKPSVPKYLPIGLPLSDSKMRFPAGSVLSLLEGDRTGAQYSGIFPPVWIFL